MNCWNKLQAERINLFLLRKNKRQLDISIIKENSRSTRCISTTDPTKTDDPLAQCLQRCGIEPSSWKSEQDSALPHKTSSFASWHGCQDRDSQQYCFLSVLSISSWDCIVKTWYCEIFCPKRISEWDVGYTIKQQWFTCINIISDQDHIHESRTKCNSGVANSTEAQYTVAALCWLCLYVIICGKIATKLEIKVIKQTLK